MSTLRRTQHECTEKCWQVATTRGNLLCALRRVGLSAVYDALCTQSLMPFVMPRHIILVRQKMVFGTPKILQETA